MKLFLIILAIFVLPVKLEASIKPSQTPAPYNDLYFNYQWALKNSGQVVLGDIDDITPFKTTGVEWANIDWSLELDQELKKDPVVAIIDSGVDIEHEDLKGRIFLNDQECNQGRIPLGKTGDPDQNGFEGDCAGWNFATPELRRQRFADDDIGHGTHVAGIIAANVNNGIGLSGLSNRIKILPLKVFDSREGKMPAGTVEGISLRVARAINYAIDRGVDVINLSLGWPILANNTEVRSAIERAESRGIAVVAAAGNDRHDAQIYPCAYKTVFCVGSLDIDGNVSRFSNFGGHIDILAPGGQILGLTPMTMSSDIFGMKGYDIKFGTSQASPYVAGAIALLKGIYPQASLDDIRSALMKTALEVSSSTAGLLQINKASQYLKNKNELFPRPLFKEFDRLVLNEKSLSAQYSIPFLHGTLLKASDISLQSLNKDILMTGEWRDEGLVVTVKAVNDWASAHLKFVVKVGDHVFEHQVLLVKEIKDEKETFTAEKGLLKNLATVIAPLTRESSPRFYQFIKEEKKLEIYDLAQGQLRKKIEIIIPEIDQILEGIGIQRVDIDLDGKLDFWVTGIKTDEEGRAQDIRYLFFDDQGELINSALHQKGEMSIKFSSEYSLAIPAQSRFISFNHPEFGDIHSLVFLSRGPLEPVDQSQDIFDPKRELLGVHLNFLMPQREGDTIVWKVRSLTKAGFQKKMRSLLGLASWAKFDLLSLRLNHEASMGKVSLLLRTGSGIVQDYYHLNISGGDLLSSALNPAKYLPAAIDLTYFKTSYDLGNQVFDTAFTIDELGELSTRTNVLGQFAKDRMRSLLLGEQDVLSNFSYRTKDPREFIASLIKEYHWVDKTVRFYELDTTLEVVWSEKQQERVFSAPLYRTSFVQGSTFSLRFTPLVQVDDQGEVTPTLYVDNSSLFSPTIYMWVGTREKVYVPLRYSFEIPRNCRAMNPALMEKRSYAVLFCGEEEDSPSVEVVAF